MTVGRMLVVRDEPDEIVVLHDNSQARCNLRQARCNLRNVAARFPLQTSGRGAHRSRGGESRSQALGLNEIFRRNGHDSLGSARVWRAVTARQLWRPPIFAPTSGY